VTGRLRQFVIGLVSLAVHCVACAESLPSAEPAEFLDWLDAEYRQNLERHGQNPEMLVRRGLLADARHRFVDLYAAATGAAAGTTIDTLISAGSSERQGTLATTPVTPAEIQDALEFIGMTPGHPIDPSRLLFSPKGERVVITFNWSDDEGRRFDRSVRAEKLIEDRSWNEHLPEIGFRFVGPAIDTESHRGAPVATLYNAQNTILEVPYIVSQSALAGRLVANANYRFAIEQRLRIRIRPEFRGQEKRVHDYIAEIAAGNGADAEQLPNIEISLTSPDGAVTASGNFETIYLFLESLVADGREPYLQLRFADTLTVQSIRNVARFTQQFLIEQDVRIEPLESHPFYSAFLPQDSWRNPNLRGRSSQPVEIHWNDSNESQGFSGQIVQHSQVAGTAPRQHSFTSVESFLDAMRGGQPWQTDGVFLIVSPHTKYEEIRKIFELVHLDFPNVYVFM
jgi:hypothetical protein